VDVNFLNKNVVSQTPYGRDNLAMKFKEYNDHPLIISNTSYQGLEGDDLKEINILVDPIVDGFS
jgi:hypothetical protein